MSMAVATRRETAPVTPMASVMTVKCACPGEAQEVDLDAVGITLHCPALRRRGDRRIQDPATGDPVPSGARPRGWPGRLTQRST